MKILKKCLTCGAEFIASKMSNKYCCRECERDASRKREAKRKKSVRESEKEAALDKERDAVASRPFLTPSDVALLLDMSVSTVYRCFYSGIIKAVRIRRKTLVRREDLDKYFEDAGPYRKRSYKRKQEQEYYTLQEIMDKYKIGRKAVWGRCDRLGIPKVYEGRNTFYSKKLIDANFSELLDVIDIDNYYTLSQIMEMYNMTQGAALCFVKYHAVPRVKRNGRSYYSKVHIDCIKHKTDEIDPDWYSYEEAMQKYGITKDQVSYTLKTYSIKTEKRGKFTMIYRTDFDNKVNDASEREHQCGRYYLIARTELKTNINIDIDIDNNIYFLYLKSNDTELPSKDSLMIPDSENELVTNVLKERFIVRSFAYDIRKWLKQLYNELIGSKDEEYLISGIHQYMDYLDFKYETSKIYSTMNNELGKYLELNNYKTIDSLISLREQANDLITTVSNIINMKIFNENKSIIKEIKKIRDGFNKSSNSDEVKEYRIMKKINNIIFCIETDLYDDKIFYGIKCTSDSLDKEIQSKIGELLEHKNTKYSTNLDGGWPIYKYASSKTPEEIYSEFVTFVNDVISSDNSISYNDKDS